MMFVNNITQPDRPDVWCANDVTADNLRALASWAPLRTRQRHTLRRAASIVDGIDDRSPPGPDGAMPTPARVGIVDGHSKPRNLGPPTTLDHPATGIVRRLLGLPRRAEGVSASPPDEGTS